MKLDSFIKKLQGIKPDLEVLIRRGYPRDFAESLLDREFSIKLKKDDKKYSQSEIIDFFENYDLNNFRIRNLGFNSEVKIIRSYATFAHHANGVSLILNLKDWSINYIFLDNDENEELFCLNSDQFFDIMFILADYSSKIYLGKIGGNDARVRETFINEANKIFNNGINEEIFG